MTHYVQVAEDVPARALCGLVVALEAHSDVPECPACRTAIIDACRNVAKLWVLPEDES